MAKVRVYELAKQLGITSKELLDILKDLGVEAVSHSSGIDESTAKLVTEVLQSPKESAAQPAPGKEEQKGEGTVKEKKMVKKVAGKSAGAQETVSPPGEQEKKVVKKVIGAELLPKAPVTTPVTAQAPVSVSSLVAVLPREADEEIVEDAPEHEMKSLTFSLPITAGELAEKMSVRPSEVIKKALLRGQAITLNQSLDEENALMIAGAFGFRPDLVKPEEAKQAEKEEEEDPRFLVSRPPVVTILGHVDHGKTSLLDAIRKTNVTAQEAGGITQKIGAYTVDHSARKIVFVDTPGHEAFTAMRARGAQVTDIAILVVAADDGVMPQTIEAIDHAKAAKVPIIVALNKIDKPQANPDRVKQQLADLGLLAEDWGGDTICIPVSAKEKTGLDDLLEMILLVADMNELKANPKRNASGIIIESRLDKGWGPVATVIVKKGTLRPGDYVIAGTSYGKVRALISDKGEKIRKATPSIPAEIVGLSEVPVAGDLLQAVGSDKIARQISVDRYVKDREKLTSGPKTTLEDFFRTLKEGEKKELNLILKADGHGSVEALRHSLSRITEEDIGVNIIHGAVGSVTESDILLASASDAIIIAFNIRLDPNIKKLAEAEKIDIRQYKVIYHVIEDIKAALKGMLEPEYVEVLLGKVEVRQVFKVSKVGVIAGCYVTEGKIIRGADVKVNRDNETIFQGRIDSLKRYKDDVKEVSEGFECGIGIDKFTGIQPGDIIEAYQLQVKPR